MATFQVKSIKNVLNATLLQMHNHSFLLHFINVLACRFYRTHLSGTHCILSCKWLIFYNSWMLDDTQQNKLLKHSFWSQYDNQHHPQRKTPTHIGSWENHVTCHIIMDMCINYPELGRDLMQYNAHMQFPQCEFCFIKLVVNRSHRQ